MAATALITMAGCSTGGQPQHQPTNDPTPSPVVDTNALQMIPLQNGDSIEVNLTGTPTVIPPIDLNLTGAGSISLPNLNTNVVAIGKSPHELEEIIRDLYVNSGIYTHINVNVNTGPRYFYVGGQVNQTGTGKQQYTGKVTVLGAISAAGGFNQYAARTRVQLTRQDGSIHYVDCKKALKHPELDLEVLPNDKIFVDQQTFGEALLGK